MVNISQIILVFLVVIIIFWIFENINEKFDVTDNEIIKSQPFKKRYNLGNDIVESPIIPKIKSIPKQNNFPPRKDDLQTQYYINRYEAEKEGDGVKVTKICPRPTQTNDEFNNDFFAFRDKVYHNSSMTYDSVDKMNDMILNGGIDQPADLKNMKIKDIYDMMTSGVDLYNNRQTGQSSKSRRLPYFDNTMHDSYNYDFISGMHNTRDNWSYHNETEINGGPLEKDFYAHDPEALRQMPALEADL